jgi:hypothetical protein
VEQCVISGNHVVHWKLFPFSVIVIIVKELTETDVANLNFLPVYLEILRMGALNVLTRVSRHGAGLEVVINKNYINKNKKLLSIDPVAAVAKLRSDILHLLAGVNRERLEVQRLRGLRPAPLMMVPRVSSLALSVHKAETRAAIRSHFAGDGTGSNRSAPAASVSSDDSPPGLDPLSNVMFGDGAEHPASDPSDSCRRLSRSSSSAEFPFTLSMLKDPSELFTKYTEYLDISFISKNLLGESKLSRRLMSDIRWVVTPGNLALVADCVDHQLTYSSPSSPVDVVLHVF